MRQTSRRAFTLIEILMVMALIGIIAGWAVTRVTSSSYRMDSNARMLQNVIIGAQQTAIQRNVIVQVMFDAAEERVRIRQDEGGSNTPVSYRALDGAQFLTPSTTIDGAGPYFLTGPGVIEINPMQRAVNFSPSGAMSGDVVLYFGTDPDRPQDQRALAITGATARTAFWSYASGSWRKRDY